MASFTKFTRFRRKLRRAKMGKVRLTKIRRDGTTPRFPVHTPESDANAPAAQLSPAARAEREG